MKKVSLIQYPDPEMAEIYPDYMKEWEIRKRFSHNIALYIKELIKQKYTTLEAIKMTARIKKERLTYFLNSSNKVITRETEWRLAYTIISLLPDLVKNEHFEKEFHNKFNAHRTHVFPSEEELKKAREGFIETFGQIGSHLIYNLKDFSEVDEMIDFYYNISKRHT